MARPALAKTGTLLPRRPPAARAEGQIKPAARSPGRKQGGRHKHWISIAIAILLHIALLAAATDLGQQHYPYHPHQASVAVSIAPQAETQAEPAAPEHASPPPAPVPKLDVQKSAKTQTQQNDMINDAADADPVPDGHYFLPEEVSAHAYPERIVPLASACLDNAHVKLKLWISESGQVERVETLQTNLNSICEQVAETAFRMTPFAPAKRGQDAVKSIWLVELVPAPAAASAQ